MNDTILSSNILSILSFYEAIYISFDSMKKQKKFLQSSLGLIIDLNKFEDFYFAFSKQLIELNLIYKEDNLLKPVFEKKLSEFEFIQYLYKNLSLIEEEFLKKEILDFIENSRKKETTSFKFPDKPIKIQKTFVF